ncbi:Enhancer of polycomb-like transcription factor protein [Thalictrum thalictroides]|uniref:Enhancer of polycomb-like protein n=1 Tax=Thalictrum thalictroides TaxID=46969 RepID=A0A7J6WTY8_THATH|nr:Enhancer of polycomb-like transcription factor protein [Thalictrum thalictroides]
MSRLSFRPRPLDIHKKLPIFKSVKDFEDEESSTGLRSSQLLRLAAEEVDNEVHRVPTKKNVAEIPTPQYDIVDTYERDYSCTFNQPTSYLRGRGARSEIGEFVEYDLDNEDEDWYEEFVSKDGKSRNLLMPEELETVLFKLEVLDHKTRERAGVITPTLSSPIPVLLQLDAAFELLHVESMSFSVFQSIFSYWRAKRERWQKPVLRRLQPPPPLNDTNPYNVFRPREKAHRLHTRRMQRRENNVLSFERLRQVRRNLEQTKTVIEALIKREEKKRELVESEVSILRVQMKYNQETQFVEDGYGFGFPPFSSTFGSSVEDEDFADSADDMTIVRLPAQPAFVQNLPFTRPLDPEKLVAAGIKPPLGPSIQNGMSAPLYRFHGRIGRGGRIIFDRWNPLLQTPIGHDSATFVTPI